MLNDVFIYVLVAKVKNEPYILFLHGYVSKNSGKMHPYALAVCRRTLKLIPDLEERGYSVKVAFLCDMRNSKSSVGAGEVMAEWMTDNGLPHSKILFYEDPNPALDSISEVERAMIIFCSERREHLGFVSVWGHHFRLRYLYWKRKLKAEAHVVFCPKKPWKILIHLLYTIPNVLDPFGTQWWSKLIMWKRRRRNFAKP